MPGTYEIFKRYLSNTFVETGSFLGDGIESAIKAGFNNIFSIELSDKYHKVCLDRFSKIGSVHIIKGDSGLLLYDIIKDIDHKITFWLDGHYSAGDTALGIAWSPLIHELDMIGKHSIKDHIILIDDLRCWEEDNPNILFGEKQIKDKLLQINCEYKFKYEDGFCKK